MSGSKIFSGDGEDGDSESGTVNGNSKNRTYVRIVQLAANRISQISFSTEEKISPKKPTTLPKVAKQRELSGTLESDADSKAKKQLSDAKSKELSGNDIFGLPQKLLLDLQGKCSSWICRKVTEQRKAERNEWQ